MRQRKNQLTLETELAKAEAEEIAYVNADSEMTANALREVGLDKEHVSGPQSQSIPKEERPKNLMVKTLLLSSQNQMPPRKPDVDPSMTHW